MKHAGCSATAVKLRDSGRKIREESGTHISVPLETSLHSVDRFLISSSSVAAFFSSGRSFLVQNHFAQAHGAVGVVALRRSVGRANFHDFSDISGAAAIRA